MGRQHSRIHSYWKEVRLKEHKHELTVTKMNNDSNVTAILYLLLYAIYYGAQIVAVIFIVRAVRRNNRRRASQNNTIRTSTSVNNASTNNTVSRNEPSIRTPINAQAVAQRPNNNTESFGPVNYFANARHNQNDKWFKFEYKRENGVWLTYILRMPSLNGRDGNAHITHRYSGGGRYWICYDPQPRNLKDAQIISRVWADRELEYIATGVPFERQNW